MDEAKDVGVLFLRQYEVNISKSAGSEPGLVLLYPAPNGVGCDYNCTDATYNYPEGEAVTLAAYEYPGNHLHLKEFTGGTGDAAVCNGETECSFSVTGDRLLGRSGVRQGRPEHAHDRKAGRRPGVHQIPQRRLLQRLLLGLLGRLLRRRRSRSQLDARSGHQLDRMEQRRGHLHRLLRRSRRQLLGDDERRQRTGGDAGIAMTARRGMD